jgi:hypothetical protein
MMIHAPHSNTRPSAQLLRYNDHTFEASSQKGFLLKPSSRIPPRAPSFDCQHKSLDGACSAILIAAEVSGRDTKKYQQFYCRVKSDGHHRLLFRVRITRNCTQFRYKVGS